MHIGIYPRDLKGMVRPKDMADNIPTIGFANLGNTCGIATVLQTILASGTLREMIEKSTFPSGSIGHELQKIVHTWRIHKGLVYKPTKLVEYIYRRSKGLFHPGEQTDIAEVWTWLFEQMHESSKWPKDHPDGTSVDPNDVSVIVRDSIYRFNEGKDSYIWQGSQGVTIGIVLCEACKYVAYNIEPYMTLSLDIPREVCSISDLLMKFMQVESLEHWKCDRCQKGNHAKRRTRLWKIPRVLVITLKRFQYTQHGEKLDTPIHISNMLAFHPGSIMSVHTLQKYHLCGVAMHHGSYYGGHYTSALKHGDAWYHCDDEHVTKIDDVAPILQNNRNAYMLVYELDS